MEKFIHDENLKLFRKRLLDAISEEDRRIICDLIAEEEARYPPRVTKPEPN
jgi:hypothetical protein